MKSLGLKSVEEYRQAVRNAVRIEPFDFLGHAGKKRALVVSANADSTVSSAYQFELAKILNAEVHIRLSGNHAEVIKTSFRLHRARIIDFFRETLKGARI